MTSEGMNRPCSRHYLATVRHTARYQVLLASRNSNASSINEQCVTALNNQHVLIEFMDMLCGSRGLSASPVRHLALIGTIKYISLDARSCLIRPSDPIRGVPHELREAVHAGASYRKEHRQPNRRLRGYGVSDSVTMMGV